MGLAFLHNSGGSGGNGALLIVTVRAGATVTVSKDDKTKTKISGESGVVRFKGLETGEWTVSATDGVQTVTGQVTITSDYVTSLAFFAATISISYPEGSTCTVSDGVTTITAPDTTGVWECIVPNEGTWTVTVTDGTKIRTESVEITSEGQNERIIIDYILFLYNPGDECVDITGGWDRLYYTGSYGYQLTLYKNADHMLCAAKTQEEYIKGDKHGMFGTLSQVDLSNFNELHAQCEVYIAGYKKLVYCYFGVGSNIAGTESTLSARSEFINNTSPEDSWVSKDVTVDVSAIKGNNQIGFYCKTDSGYARYQLRIKKVWLE